MTEDEFLKKFEEFSLLPEDFNHRGHLWLGWLYVRDHSLRVAAEKLNTGIKMFAESLGATEKFHCTLTTTFACAIKSRFKNNQTFEEFLEENWGFEQNAMKIIETHYSPELLNTKEARERLVSPDREPLPEEYQKQIEEQK